MATRNNQPDAQLSCVVWRRHTSIAEFDYDNDQPFGLLSPKMSTRRFGHITPVELLVIVAVFGTIAALFLPAGGSPPPLTDKDLHLNHWQPGPGHSAVPMEAIRVNDVDLAGTWTDGMRWTNIEIKPLPDGRYGVSFLSHGRCGLGGSVQLERIAEYDDGVLLLNRPVRELTGATYQRLFSVRVNDGSNCLVPSVHLIEFNSDTSEIPYRGVLTLAAQQ